LRVDSGSTDFTDQRKEIRVIGAMGG
jgi:hypothetical protein